MASKRQPYATLMREFLRCHTEHIGWVRFDLIEGVQVPQIDREAGNAFLVWCIRVGKCASYGVSHDMTRGMIECWVAAWEADKNAI